VGVGATPGSYKLYVSGDAWTTGSWGGSDLRWKKNIQTIGDALSKIVQLTGVKYDWRSDEFPEMNFDNKTHIGVIAQDIERVFPELVITDNNGFKAVAYDKLSAILIEGIKEQQQQIQEQRSEIEQLKADMEVIKAFLTK
jgi:hypothetical protein